MHPILRYTAAALLTGAIPLTASAMSRKPECTVRFHMEVRATEKDPFSIPVKLQNPPRQIFMESTASISERQIQAIHVFPANDGTWGCLFKLDDSGRLTLSNLSASNRGRTLVVYVGSDKITRQVIDIFIDRPVNDGMIPIMRGLTYPETELLKKKFPVAIKPTDKP
ncbi:MAG: hypothetical protein WCO60_02210 [Verrucomicrobiota bacterium]